MVATAEALTLATPSAVTTETTDAEEADQASPTAACLS